MAVVYALIGSVLVGLVGHSQTQHMFKTPADEDGGRRGTVGDASSRPPCRCSPSATLSEREEVFSIQLPVVMSLLTCNNLTGEVQGINDLQAEYEQIYGPGDYVPPVPLIYWTFRIMMTAGMLMIAAGSAGLVPGAQAKRLEQHPWFLRLLPLGHFPALPGQHRGLAADRGRPPALDRLWPDAHGGRGLGGRLRLGRCSFPWWSLPCSTAR